MPLDVSCRITLAEGFSYLHRKVSLLNVFHAIEWDRARSYEQDFVVLFECFGLANSGQLLELEIVEEAEGFREVAKAVSELEPGETQDVSFAVVPFQGVIFPGPGRYNVVAKIGGEYAHQWPFTVKEHE